MKYAFLSLFSLCKVNMITITTATFILSFILGFSFLNLISIDRNNSDYSIISPIYARPQVSPDGPILNDPNLIVETVYQGLKSPTSMAFLGQTIF